MSKSGATVEREKLTRLVGLCGLVCVGVGVGVGVCECTEQHAHVLLHQEPTFLSSSSASPSLSPLSLSLSLKHILSIIYYVRESVVVVCSPRHGGGKGLIRWIGVVWEVVQWWEEKGTWCAGAEAEAEGEGGREGGLE